MGHGARHDVSEYEVSVSGDFPFSERFRVAGEDWVDKESAAQLLEDTKSAIMAQKQAALGDLPVNRAEQIVKASPEWEIYLHKIVEARKEANLAKITMETERLRFMENQSREANARAEMKL